MSQGAETSCHPVTISIWTALRRPAPRSPDYEDLYSCPTELGCFLFCPRVCLLSTPGRTTGGSTLDFYIQAQDQWLTPTPSDTARVQVGCSGHRVCSLRVRVGSGTGSLPSLRCPQVRRRPCWPEARPGLHGPMVRCLSPCQRMNRGRSRSPTRRSSSWCWRRSKPWLTLTPWKNPWLISSGDTRR